MNPELQDLHPEGDMSMPSNPPQEGPAGRTKQGRIWTGVVVALALGAFFGARRYLGSSGTRKGEPQAVRAVPVTVTEAKTGDMPITLSGLGTVTPLNSVTVKSRVDGQLIRFPIQEGQMVHQGELIAEIDPRPFHVQLMQAEGQRAKDEAAFKNASQDLTRYKALVEQGILSRQQLDAQTASVNQYEAALKADQGQVESAKLNLAYSRITAPISGKAGLRLVDPGNIVRASDANGLCVINPVQPITVLFTIPADSISQVQARSAGGQRLQVEAYDRDLKHKLATGSILAIDNQVDPATGTVRIKALFDNRDNALFPNQFVNVRLLVDTLRGVVVVPTAALQRGPQGPFVYRIKPDGTAELAVVEPAASDGDVTALRKGLAPGDRVVTDGLERLRPGLLVAIAKPGQAAGRKGRP